MTKDEHRKLKPGDIVYPMFGNLRGVKCVVLNIDWTYRFPGTITVYSEDETAIPKSVAKDYTHGALSLKPIAIKQSRWKKVLDEILLISSEDLAEITAERGKLKEEIEFLEKDTEHSEVTAGLLHKRAMLYDYGRLIGMVKKYYRI
jgi:hypothetical protein